MHAAIRRREDGHRPVQPRDAADARRQLHPRRRHRPRGRGRRPAVRASVAGRSARSSGGSASTSPSWSPTARRSSWASARSRPRRRWPCATSATSAIHTEMFTDAVVDLVEAGVDHRRRARSATAGKIVTAFLMGSQRLYDFVARQPDGRDAPGRLHQRHPRHPLVQPDGRDQLRDRGRPDRPGRRRLDRPRLVFAASAARWTSSAARRWPTRAGRSSPSRRPPAAGRSRGSSHHFAEGAGVVTTRAHVRTVVTEYGVAELFGPILRERAKALIAIAHPDHRDALRRETSRAGSGSGTLTTARAITRAIPTYQGRSIPFSYAFPASRLSGSWRARRRRPRSTAWKATRPGRYASSMATFTETDTVRISLHGNGLLAHCTSNRRGARTAGVRKRCQSLNLPRPADLRAGGLVPIGRAGRSGNSVSSGSKPTVIGTSPSKNLDDQPGRAAYSGLPSNRPRASPTPPRASPHSATSAPCILFHAGLDTKRIGLWPPT